MRAAAAMLVLVVGTAHADKKIQDMIPGYDRESTACQSQSKGMQKIATGVATLAKTAPEPERPELEKAAAALAKGTAMFDDYCTELTSLVAYLKDQANASYKTVEREIDTRATKVSRLRRDAKKQTEELTPLTRKMIPRIMTVRTAPAEPEKRTTVKFPSGRSAEFPVMAGTWRATSTATGDSVEYADKDAKLVISTRQVAGSCDDHKSAIPKGDVTEVEAKPAAWAVKYVRKEDSGAHAVVLACVATGTKSVIATGDLAPPNATLAEAMPALVLRMAAAFKN
jgi:hypothetical protein